MTVDFAAFVRRVRRPGWLILCLIATFGGFCNRVSATESVELTWSPSTSPNIVAYKIYYGIQSGIYSTVLTVTNTDQIVTGLADDEAYYFTVTALDSQNNESPFSNEAVYTTPVSSVGALLVQAATNASDSVMLSWDPSSNPYDYGYAVYYGGQSGNYTNYDTFDGVTSGMISGLVPGGTYYFIVAPIDFNGIEAPFTEEVSYVVPTVPSLVLQAQMPANSPGVQLTWNDIPNEGVTGYYVYCGAASGQYNELLYCGVTNEFLVQGLAAGVPYYFKVASVDAYGDQSFVSNEAISDAAAPSPINLLVTCDTNALNAVNVAWTTNAENAITGYQVYYGTESGTYDNIMDFPGVSGGMISGLQAGATYYFAVAPVDSFGVEAIASPEVSYSVPALPPMSLQAQALPGGGGVQLNWTPVPNEGVVAYNIFYGTQSGSYPVGQTFGNVNSAVIQYLNPGQPYYFVVAALDIYGDQSQYSNQAMAVTTTPQPMILQIQTYTDDNGQPYVIEVNTPSTVYGNWEMDTSTDLQNWTPYTYGYGSGAGDGYDVDAYIYIDPTQPQVFVRVINN